MKDLPKANLPLTALFLLTALVACGGGGGGSASSGTPTPSAAAVSQGVLTAKGSVFVNGIEFNTASATIKVDDNPGVESDLKVGMVIKVRGTKDDATRTGIASEVEARDALEGTIDDRGVDAANGTLTVSGQTVRVEDNMTRLNDDDTLKVFAGANFQPGDRVEVHGFPDDRGGVRATRVARKASGEFELKGFVADLGATAFNLTLTPGGASALTVSFSAGALPAGLANGARVQVKSAAAPVAGVVTAALIKLEDKLAGAGEKVEVEGIVTSGTVDDFLINNQHVLTSANTLFEGGLKGDFAVGVKLEAAGPLDASGAIAAVKVSFRSSIKLEADASAVSATSLTLLGLPIAINGFTRIDNGPIANGNHVEVRATLDRDGHLLATRVIKQSASTKAFIQGPVTAKDSAGGTLTLLGLVVGTNSRTEFRKRTDSLGTPVDAATFFAQVTPNATIIKARWDAFSGTTNPVEQVEIQLGK